MPQADPDKVREGLTKAMGLLTAWNESSDGDTTFPATLLAEYTMEDGRPLEGLLSVASGLLSLAGTLLLEVAHHTGKTPEQVLQIIGPRLAGGR